MIRMKGKCFLEGNHLRDYIQEHELIFVSYPCIFSVVEISYLYLRNCQHNFKECQIYTKIYINKILYKNSRFERIIFSKYTSNLKTTISKGSLRNLGLLLLLFEINHFSFIKDLIDNIIFGGSSDHILRTYLSYYQLYLLIMKNFKLKY